MDTLKNTKISPHKFSIEDIFPYHFDPSISMKLFPSDFEQPRPEKYKVKGDLEDHLRDFCATTLEFTHEETYYETLSMQFWRKCHGIVFSNTSHYQITSRIGWKVCCKSCLKFWTLNHHEGSIQHKTKTRTLLVISTKMEIFYQKCTIWNSRQIVDWSLLLQFD